MWNLTPDYLANAKEELKGRRAAIQALIAEELKEIEADIEEIETLERAAYAFAVKHLPKVEPEQATAPPRELEAEPEQMAALQAEPVEANRDDPEPVPKEEILTRWRIRAASKAAAENA